MAATLVLFFRSMDQTLGVAIEGAVLSDQARKCLQFMQLYLTSDQTQGNSVSTNLVVEKLKQLQARSAQATQAHQALTQSFQVIWTVMCGFAIKEYDMNQNHETEQRFVAETQDSRVVAESGPPQSLA